MRIRTHTNPFCCRQRFKRLNKPDAIDFRRELDLEIGFGKGLFIREYAKKNLDRFVVGVDVRKKTVELLQQQIMLDDIKNIYPAHGNGYICLQDMFDDRSVDNIFIFHPDPWLKRRHQNRRVINEPFLDVAKKKLKKTGKIYVSTDVESLWDDIIEMFNKSCFFVQKKQETFWNDYYLTRWYEISKEKKRNIFYATFCLTL